ncbi:MAG: glutamine synthetase family protein [Pseudomonadota bacterium]
MTDTTEAEAFLAAHPDTRHLDAFLIDLNGHAFGKRYPVEDLINVATRGSSICAAMQTTDVTGEAWDTMGLGFSDGDPDAATVMVPGTLAPVPWAPSPRAQCLMRFVRPTDGGPVWWEPRLILEGVVERLAADGLRPVVAVEIEFHLIDAERTGEGAPQLPRSPLNGQRRPAGEVFRMSTLDEFGPVIDAIEANCRAQGLPVTTLAKEFGPGQYEVNLAHIDDPVTAADHAALLRRAVVATARAQGYDATFMSKPFAGQAGNGLQINLSIQDEAGRNIFDPDYEGGASCLGHAVAGMQALFAESMLIFAPSFHAFRRVEPNQFTPVTRDWGEDNRSVAFRLPFSDPANRRIEHRIAGAEANPYLVMAAVLAAAHHGLSQGLTPTPIGTGNVGEEADPGLPLTFWDAMAQFKAGAVLPDYFGGRYIEAYAHAKQSEFDSFMSAPSPREFAWYL